MSAHPKALHFIDVRFSPTVDQVRQYAALYAAQRHCEHAPDNPSPAKFESLSPNRFRLIGVSVFNSYALKRYLGQACNAFDVPRVCVAFFNEQGKEVEWAQ